MKYLKLTIIPFLILSSIGYLLANQDKKEIYLVNEIKNPSNSAWVKSGNLEVQIFLPVKKVFPNAQSMPLLMWLKNSTDKAEYLTINGNSSNKLNTFTAHGEINITDPNGKNISSQRCFEKHVTMKIKIKPGETRIFYCDAFDQDCVSREKGKLMSGVYTVKYKGAVQKFEVFGN